MSECQTCHGDRFVRARLRDHSGKLDFDGCREHTIPCDMCNGKGHITQADRDAYRASWCLWEIGIGEKP